MRMDVPGSMDAHTSTLCICRHPLERVRVTQSCVLAAPQRSLNSIVFAALELIDPIEHVVYHTGIEPYVDFRLIDEEWSAHIGSPDEAVQRIQAAVHEHGRERTVLVVDLESLVDGVSSDGAGAEQGERGSTPETRRGQVLAIAAELERLARRYPVALVALCAQELIPEIGGALFFDLFGAVHVGHGAFHGGFDILTKQHSPASGMLDASLQRLALSEESLIRQLAASESAAGSVEPPHFLALVDEVMVVLDSSLRITYISPAVERHLGRPARSLIGRNLSALSGKADAGSAQTALTRILHHHLSMGRRSRSETGSFKGEVTRPVLVPIFGEDSAGNEVLFEASVTVYEAAGKVKGYLCVLRRQSGRGQRQPDREMPTPQAQGGRSREQPSDGQGPGNRSEPSHISAEHRATDRATDQATDADGGEQEGDVSLRLTPREFEIIQHLLEGLSNMEIADRLKIAEVTVKKHLTSVYQKLGVRNRYEVMKLAR
jgi:DNA-binding CsgD family transcriptional regulator/PAS domain-containing protein